MALKAEEVYAILKKQIQSGGATPEQIQQAVDAYLEENPVQPGATVEQAAQIEKNKTDISSVKEDVSSLSEEKISKDRANTISYIMLKKDSSGIIQTDFIDKSQYLYCDIANGESNQLLMNDITEISISDEKMIYIQILSYSIYNGSVDDFDRLTVSMKWYSEEGVELPGGGNFLNIKTGVLFTNRTVPENAKKLKISFNVKRTSALSSGNFEISFGLVLCDYAKMISYSDGVVIPIYLKDNVIDKNVNELYSKMSDINPTDILVPKKLYAVKGMPVYVYKDNCLIYGKGKRNFVSITVNNADYYTFSNACRIIPQNIGSNPVIPYKLLDYYENIYKSNKIDLLVSDRTMGSKVNVMVIGDSRTRHGYTTKRLIDLFSSPEDGTELELIGTCQPDAGTSAYSEENWHEGRSSWDTNNYIHDQSYYLADNAFFNPNTQTFDYSYYVSAYFEKRGKQYPNTGRTYVLIHLGTNDFYHRENFETEKEAIDVCVKNLQIMVNSIHNYSNDIIIGIVPTVNIFGLNEKLQEYTKAIMSAFEDKENENTYIVPSYVNLDLDHGFEMGEEEIINENIPNIKEKKSDSTHENEKGYYCTGDEYYYFIKYVESQHA